MIDINQFIAFALDFEGCLSVERSYTKRGTYRYGACVRIVNTEKELLEEFKNIVKFGSIDNGKLSYENTSKIYSWSLTRQEMEIYLPNIKPYLIIKWRQAELILELYSILKTDKFTRTLSYFQKREMYTDEEINTLNSIYWECKELNKKYKYKNSTIDEFIRKLKTKSLK